MKKYLSILLIVLLMSTAVGASEAIDPFEKYDPPISLVVTNSVGAGYTFREGEDLENNVYVDMYRDDLGINLEFMWTMASNEVDQKVNVTITSGDIPDLMRVNALQLKQLVDSGMIADLTDLQLV